MATFACAGAGTDLPGATCVGGQGGADAWADYEGRIGPVIEAVRAN
jgi:protein involved in temperature-dependent protein secretion